MTHVKQNVITPALSNFPCSFRSNGGGGKLSVGILLLLILNNLMNTLTRKFKNICNRAQRFATLPEFKNLQVSVLIRRWARTQWSPLPIQNLFQTCNTFGAQFILPVPLAHVSDPSAKWNFITINALNKNRGNTAMSFANCINFQTLNCYLEARDVVHGQDNSKSFLKSF